MNGIEFREVSKRYGSDASAPLAVRGISFEVPEGTLTTILGPSGCGKTTTLRMIAGLESPTSGQILIAGKDVTTLGPAQRNVSMMFQSYALFPHMNVADNVGYGLRMSGQSKERARTRAVEALASVGLVGFDQRLPSELSGGQQQRVALARALAPRPELILLDEPFSNLDVGLRERLSVEVREILKREGSTAIMVTHDQHEAFAMADQIGIMYEGRIQQWDVPYNLYHRPANRFVADFIGQGVLVTGTVGEENSVRMELGTLISDTPVSCNESCTTCDDGCAVDILLRPDDIVHDDASPVQAEVLHKAFRGADILYTLRLASGTEVLSLVPSHHNHALGEKIGIRLDADHVIAFSRPSPADCCRTAAT